MSNINIEDRKIAITSDEKRDVIKRLKSGKLKKLANVVLRQIDFNGIDFSRITIKNCDLSHCNFQGSKFDKAEISDSEFNYSNFEGASFINTSMTNSSLLGADLTNTRGSNVDLRGTFINTEHIDDAGIFNNAKIDGSTTLPNVHKEFEAIITRLKEIK